MTNQIVSSLKVITLAIVLSFGLSYVYAWTAPTVAPTGGNVLAPLNTSGTAQTKNGGLTVSSITSPSHCIGTSCITTWPTSGPTPPTGSTFLDTSATAQTKTGDLTVNGSMTASAYYYSSDESLKGNIISLKDSLDKITQLGGYSFEWKKDGRKDVGVIAQEVEKIFPELVLTDISTGLKSVEYGNLVAPLIESVKELKKITDSQDRQIKELKEEIKTLKSYVKN